MTFLYIISEFALVLGTIYMCILTIAVGHIVFEFALINVSFSVPKSTLSFCLIVTPLTLVMSTVIPVLNAVTMSYYVRQGVVRGGLGGLSRAILVSLVLVAT
jgi:hypothetical protein